MNKYTKDELMKRIQCVYPWTSLSIRLNSTAGVCFASHKEFCTLNDFSTLNDVHNHPERQKHRKYMIERKSCKEQYCVTNCEYMSCNQTSLESQIKKYGMLPIFEEILMGKTILDNPPEVIDVNIDNVCNYNCEMCHGIKNKNFRVSSSFFNILDEINSKSKNGFRVVWIGGETLFSPWSKKMLVECSQRFDKMRVCLLSNGSIFDIDILSKIKIDNITLSIDSLNPDTYSKIRKNGKLENVLMNLNRFINYRNSRPIRFPVSVTCVITSHNYKEIPEIISYFSKLDNINLHFRFGMICNKGVDVFYRSQSSDLLFKELKKIIDVSLNMKDISNFEDPALTIDSLNSLKRHLLNYQYIDHGYVNERYYLQ